MDKPTETLETRGRWVRLCGRAGVREESGLALFRLAGLGICLNSVCPAVISYPYPSYPYSQIHYLCLQTSSPPSLSLSLPPPPPHGAPSFSLSERESGGEASQAIGRVSSRSAAAKEGGDDNMIDGNTLRTSHSRERGKREKEKEGDVQ